MAHSAWLPVPAVGNGILDVEIIAWRVSAGDRIRAGDVLVEVATDKADVDIIAPISGIIEELAATPGETLYVGEPLVRFRLTGDVPLGRSILGEPS